MRSFNTPLTARDLGPNRRIPRALNSRIQYSNQLRTLLYCPKRGKAITELYYIILLGAAISIILRCLGLLGSVLFGAETPGIAHTNLYRT